MTGRCRPLMPLLNSIRTPLALPRLSTRTQKWPYARAAARDSDPDQRNIDTHDRMQTTAGSLALEGSIAPRDAFIVKRLRRAGAVILGKTNLSEWANFAGNTPSADGRAGVGLTRNPYRWIVPPAVPITRFGCGQVAAEPVHPGGLAPETDGFDHLSRLRLNGIVGSSPRWVWSSRSGIIPIAHSQDTAGPMARNVADAAILLGVLTGWISTIRNTAEQEALLEGLHSVPRCKWSKRGHALEWRARLGRLQTRASSRFSKHAWR